MKKAKRHSMLAHAAQMLMRNIRSYALLSVTIVLSFSLLLGYLAFMDSELYNRYKIVLSLPRDVVMAYTTGADPSGQNALNAVADKAQEVDETVQQYMFFNRTAMLEQYGQIYADVCFLPSGERPYYEMGFGGDSYTDILMYAIPITPIMGKDRFNLLPDEAIVNESFFRAISPDGTLPVALTVPFTWDDGTTSYFKVNVTGVVADYTDDQLTVDEQGQVRGYAHIFLSQDWFGDRTSEQLGFGCRRAIWMSTQYPNTLAEYAQSQGLIVHSISEAQDTAIETIRVQKATKGIIAVVLLLLLGINLYSSFTNALNDRKYEIGVKRAIGASGGAIMRQFLFESMLVMLANILLSVVIVADGLALYKLYQQLVEGREWIVSVSSYTALMFGVCSVTLTVVFSLLFAYKSTNVEIVQYLKAE